MFSWVTSIFTWHILIIWFVACLRVKKLSYFFIAVSPYPCFYKFVMSWIHVQHLCPCPYQCLCFPRAFESYILRMSYLTIQIPSFYSCLLSISICTQYFKCPPYNPIYWQCVIWGFISKRWSRFILHWFLVSYLDISGSNLTCHVLFCLILYFIHDYRNVMIFFVCMISSWEFTYWSYDIVLCVTIRMLWFFIYLFVWFLIYLFVWFHDEILQSY